MQSFDGILDDLLSYCTCKLFYRFPSSKVIYLFEHVLTHLTHLNEQRNILTKVSCNSLPAFASYHICFFLYVPGKHQKMNTFSDLIELSNQNPRRQSSLWLWCLPQALGSWESQWLLQEVGTPCPLIAIEQYGSSINSKWAWFWWILYKHFLYLHLWPGQTYTFT